MSNPNNVAGGYKATISNPNTSEEAKEHAREQLEAMGKGDEVPADVQQSEEVTVQPMDEGKNEGNVIGGYKATLKNPNVSDDAKEHAKEVLEGKGVEV